MKKFLTLTAITLATISTTVMADTYLTAQGGYQWSPDNTKKHERQQHGYSQDSHGFGTVALGTQVSSNAYAQVEYSNVKASGNNATAETKQQTISLVGIVPVTRVAATDVYALGGAGYTYLTGDNVQKEESSVGIVGLGLRKDLNDTVAFVTEARGQYNLVHNYWQPQVTAGLRINLDQLVKTTSSR